MFNIEKPSNSFLKSMIPSDQLMELLGYEDIRSLKKWCDKHEVPLIKIGQRYVAHAWTIEVALLRIFQREAFQYGLDGNALTNALVNDDKVRVAHLMNAPIDEEQEESYSKRKKKEGNCDDLIDEFKKKTA